MEYIKRQISQWEMPSEHAFVVVKQVNTGLSSALCQWVFHEKESNRIVPKNCGRELQEHLREMVEHA